MGKLKTSLSALAAIADSIEKKGDKTLGDLQGCATSVKEVGCRVAGGYELLYMYLKQKAVAQKAKIEAWNKDPLKSHMDPKVADFIKHIETARGELANVYKNYDETTTLLIQIMGADLDRALAFAADIQAQVAKKKKKLLQSARHKAKIVAYEASLGQLAGKLSTLKVNVASYRQQTQSGGPKKIASLKITDATTIAQVFSVAELGLKQELDKIKAQTQGKRLGVLLKNYGNEIKQIRSWVTEADAMEADGG